MFGDRYKIDPCLLCWLKFGTKAAASPQEGSPLGHSFLFTDVINNVLGLLCNDSDSVVDLGDLIPGGLVGDISVAVRVNFYDFGEYNTGRIIDNGKFMIWTAEANECLGCSSNYTSFSHSTDYSIEKDMWNDLLITREADGTVAYHINGQLNPTTERFSGTPEAGVTNNLVGNREDGSRAFRGYIADLRIYRGIRPQLLEQHKRRL